LMATLKRPKRLNRINPLGYPLEGIRPMLIRE
jgi:hypothetical protein